MLANILLAKSKSSHTWSGKCCEYIRRQMVYDVACVVSAVKLHDYDRTNDCLLVVESTVISLLLSCCCCCCWAHPHLSHRALPILDKKLSYGRDSAHLRSLRFLRSFKATDFDIDRNPVCDFILMNNTKFYCISRTVSSYRAKLVKLIGLCRFSVNSANTVINHCQNLDLWITFLFQKEQFKFILTQLALRANAFSI